MGGFDISIKDEIAFISFDKDPTANLIISVISDLSKEYPNTPRLFDFRNGWSLTMTDLRRIAEFAVDTSRPKLKIAILAKTDLSFGLARMYEVFRDRGLNETNTFRDMKDAIEWLKAENNE